MKKPRPTLTLDQGNNISVFFIFNGEGDEYKIIKRSLKQQQQTKQS